MFKFAKSEDKVARRDFIAECLPDLCDAEWELWMNRINYVFEVYEYATGSLGSQITDRARLRTYFGLEHHIELPNVAQGVSIWTFDTH